jgi:hypothetical protein
MVQGRVDGIEEKVMFPRPPGVRRSVDAQGTVDRS